MTDSNNSVQISGNIGNGYFILIGNNVAELEKHSLDLAEAFDRITENLTVVQQVVMAKEVFSKKESAFQKAPASTGSVAQPQASAPAQKASSAPAGPAPTCRHGEMLWKDFVSKAGNPVTGHFCTSTDRDDSCPPKYPAKKWGK